MVNKNRISLKDQFAKQEEQRMIKSAERAFLKAKVGGKKAAAEKAIIEFKSYSYPEPQRKVVKKLPVWKKK